MRTAFIVLVFLCIEHSTAFIVPSVVVKEEYALRTLSDLSDIQNQDLVHPNYGKNRDESTINPILEEQIKGRTKKQNVINNHEIYDQENLKESNVNERSFIIIKQKYLTPFMNQMHSTGYLNSLYSDNYMNLEKDYFLEYIKKIKVNKPMYFKPENKFDLDLVNKDQDKETCDYLSPTTLNNEEGAYTAFVNRPFLGSMKMEQERKLSEPIVAQYGKNQGIRMEPTLDKNLKAEAPRRINNLGAQQDDRRKNIIHGKTSSEIKQNAFSGDPSVGTRYIRAKLNCTTFNCTKSEHHDKNYSKKKSCVCHFVQQESTSKSEVHHDKEVVEHITETTTKSNFSVYEKLYNDIMDINKSID